ncbi:uncharacterized protein LOC133173913 [Saccostrea echinata]|uniref:uncharacterized protein LOC133173913 n=1 Tax=Saccostrea echinata TaxID=191078 RepID=UPI002A7FBBC2|nr:uncharacterized protein LOC133173913 [Saccostrea echinata]
MDGFLSFLQWIVLIGVINIASGSGPRFRDAQLVARMENLNVSDASGLAASRKHRGVLYTHNDGDKNDPYLYAINASNAAIISTLRLYPAQNQRWEDIAVGPCGTTSCIYVGDMIGAQTIYRVEEPDFIYSDQILTDVSAIQYRWDSHSDVLMVDIHGNVYLISNQEHHNHGRRVGLLAAESWNSNHTVNITTNVHLPHLHHLSDNHDPSSGDISPDGKQILLVSFNDHAYYWKVENDDVLSSLRHAPVFLPTRTHGVIEGICWDTEGRNYYEISESHHEPPPLYIFNRV